MRRWLLTIVCCCPCALSVLERPPAVTYYVDSATGSDSKDGTSSSTAWQTIARVNRTTFHPGDSILFRRGDIWREQLNITSSGSFGNPITFGSYGVGTPPIISGADLVTGWGEEIGRAASLGHASGEMAWRVDRVGSTNQVFEDGNRLADSMSIDALKQGSFYFDPSNHELHVRTLADDNPNDHAMEVSQRNYAIVEAGGKSFVTVQNLEATAANNANIYFNGSVSITISNAFVTNSFNDGIRFDVVSNGIIDSTTAAWNGSNGISADDVPNLVIRGCTAHDNSALRNGNYTAGIKINSDYAPYAPSRNVTIENSESYSNGSKQDISSEWIGAGIWADTIQDGLLVQRNLVHSNNLMGIYLDAVNHATVAYNVVYGNGKIGAIDGGGVAVYGDGRPIAGDRVYNDTVYENPTGQIKVRGASLERGCENLAVQNNIALGTPSGANLVVTGGCENDGTRGSGNVYSYNALGPEYSGFIEFGDRRFLSTYRDFDGAVGEVTHSVTGDVSFANARANDFTLLPTSPAIGAGIDLGPSFLLGLSPGSTWPLKVRTSEQNSNGTGWVVGAYVLRRTQSKP